MLMRSGRWKVQHELICRHHLGVVCPTLSSYECVNTVCAKCSKSASNITYRCLFVCCCLFFSNITRLAFNFWYLPIRTFLSIKFAQAALLCLHCGSIQRYLLNCLMHVTNPSWPVFPGTDGHCKRKQLTHLSLKYCPWRWIWFSRVKLKVTCSTLSLTKVFVRDEYSCFCRYLIMSGNHTVSP